MNDLVSSNAYLRYLMLEQKRALEDDEDAEQPSEPKRRKALAKASSPTAINPRLLKGTSRYGGLPDTVLLGTERPEDAGKDRITDEDRFWMLWGSCGDCFRASIVGTFVAREIQEFPPRDELGRTPTMKLQGMLATWWFTLKSLKPTFRWLETEEIFNRFVGSRIDFGDIQLDIETVYRTVREYQGDVDFDELDRVIDEDEDLESDLSTIAALFGVPVEQDLGNARNKTYEVEDGITVVARAPKRFYPLGLDIETTVKSLQARASKLSTTIQTGEEFIQNALEQDKADFLGSRDLEAELLQAQNRRTKVTGKEDIAILDELITRLKSEILDRNIRIPGLEEKRLELLQAREDQEKVVNRIADLQTFDSRQLGRRTTQRTCALLARLLPAVLAVELWGNSALSQATNPKTKGKRVNKLLSNTLDQTIKEELIDVFIVQMVFLASEPFRASDFDGKIVRKPLESDAEFAVRYAAGEALLKDAQGVPTELGIFKDTLLAAVGPLSVANTLTDMVVTFRKTKERKKLKLDAAAAALAKYFAAVAGSQALEQRIAPLDADIENIERIRQKRRSLKRRVGFVYRLNDEYFEEEPSSIVRYRDAATGEEKEARLVGRPLDESEIDEYRVIVNGQEVTIDYDLVIIVIVPIRESITAVLKELQARRDYLTFFEEMLEDPATFLTLSLQAFVLAGFFTLDQVLNDKPAGGKTDGLTSTPKSFEDLVTFPIVNAMKEANPNVTEDPQSVLAGLVGDQTISLVNKDEWGNLIPFLYHDGGIWSVWNTQLASEIWIWVLLLRDKFFGTQTEIPNISVVQNINRAPFLAGDHTSAEFVYAIDDNELTFGVSNEIDDDE